MKKIFRIIGLMLVLVIIYLIVGAIAPFIRYSKVTEEEKEQLYTMDSFAKAAQTDRAMLLEDNTTALTERLRLMNQAKKDIVMTTFDMRDGESARDIAAMLYQKAEEGVHVRILVDGMNTLIHMEGKEVFYALASHPNIEIRGYNNLNLLEPWKTQGRMHDKYVIVDDTAYIAGGRNTYDYFLGNYAEKSRSLDREVFIYNAAGEEAGTAAGMTAEGTQDSSLYELRSYFENVWSLDVCSPFHESQEPAEQAQLQTMIEELRERYQTLEDRNAGVFEEPDYAAMTVPTQGVLLLTGETGIYGKKPLIFAQIMKLTKQAEQSVVIHTPYIVCNDQMCSELTELAAEVPTRVVINSIANGDNFCASSDYLYHKQDIIDTGVKLYEYDGGNSTHGKSVVIDQEVSIIGSYNMDLRSTYMDTELMVAVKSTELAAQLTGYMDGIQADSRQVLTKDTYDDPAHLQVQSTSGLKKTLMYVFGFVMQAFRFEI